MKKILGAIFGSSKNTETIVDGAVAGLDKIFFTAEEKSEANQKLSDWYLKYLAATQPQNLARRFIAIIVVLLWSLLLLGAVGVYHFEPDYSEFIFRTLRDNVNTPFSIIIGFYFAAHLARSWQNNKK